MQYVKLQLVCLMVILYILCSSLIERKVGFKAKSTFFFVLTIVGAIETIFDGATAYTVNNLDIVPPLLNKLLHLGFLWSLDLCVFLVFAYMQRLTDVIPKNKGIILLCALPLVVSFIVTAVFINELEYRTGVTTNYSMGISAYVCFVVVAVYLIASVAIVATRWRFLERHKKASVVTGLASLSVVTILQMIFPELLITALVPTVIILGGYINQENPSLIRLNKFLGDMVTGFSTLIENRDDSTGFHVLRTTAYVKLIAARLQESGYHKELLTKDYIQNLALAAPMHDVGKIAIPDDVLKKPGKLSAEEFEIMKTHAAVGGEIIKQTFGRTGRKDYCQMAYEVARYHHEKWNGKGYPEGLSGEDIPLAARIMAVADVFDAVSEKRCYRDAMPLDECFKIIEDGIGRDFDPTVAQAFLNAREQVEEVRLSIEQEVAGGAADFAQKTGDNI